ncbi:hypothetical protein B0H14DRAFT_3154800 [Mycena olivaceomarginata]|nr:hypothetical protein B0H14DRAFT_3154800 [Mycena olivaceomarginata]
MFAGRRRPPRSLGRCSGARCLGHDGRKHSLHLRGCHLLSICATFGGSGGANEGAGACTVAMGAGAGGGVGGMSGSGSGGTSGSWDRLAPAGSGAPTFTAAGSDPMAAARIATRPQGRVEGGWGAASSSAAMGGQAAVSFGATKDQQIPAAATKPAATRRPQERRAAASPGATRLQEAAARRQREVAMRGQREQRPGLSPSNDMPAGCPAPSNTVRKGRPTVAGRRTGDGGTSTKSIVCRREFPARPTRFLGDPSPDCCTGTPTSESDDSMLTGPGGGLDGDVVIVAHIAPDHLVGGSRCTSLRSGGSDGSGSGSGSLPSALLWYGAPAAAPAEAPQSQYDSPRVASSWDAERLARPRRRRFRRRRPHHSTPPCASPDLWWASPCLALRLGARLGLGISRSGQREPECVGRVEENPTPNRDDGVVGAEVVGDLKGHIGAGCAGELGAAGSPPELCDGGGRGAGRSTYASHITLPTRSGFPPPCPQPVGRRLRILPMLQ